MAWSIIVAALTMIVVPAKADTHSLKIGVLAPLEGAFGPLGKDAVRGYELALSEHEGRAGERPIEAFVESTDGTPDSVIAKARMLIDRGASILIGPLAGIEGIAIREFAKGVPEVTFINGASAAQDATLRAPADNFFRFNPDSNAVDRGARALCLRGERHPHDRLGRRGLFSSLHAAHGLHAGLLRPWRPSAGAALDLRRCGRRRAHRRDRVRYGDRRAVPGFGAPCGQKVSRSLCRGRRAGCPL